ITVIDDYLQDAKVWLDYNQDFIHQADEPFAMTNQSGVAALYFPNDVVLGEHNLVALGMVGKTLDTRTGQLLDKDYLLTTPRGQQVISPLTSVAQGYISQGQTLEGAQNEICNKIGVTPCNIYGDYIADDATTLLGYARAYMNAMPNSADTVDYIGAVDKSNIINDAINAWIANNNLSAQAVNWSALQMTVNELGAYDFSSSFSSDYEQHRSTAIYEVASELASLLRDNYFNGYKTQYDLAEINAGAFDCPNGGTQTYQGSVQDGGNNGTGSVSINRTFVNCAFFEGGVVTNSKSEFSSQNTTDYRGDIVTLNNQFQVSKQFQAQPGAPVQIGSNIDLTATSSLLAGTKTNLTNLSGVTKYTVNGQHYFFSIHTQANAPLHNTSTTTGKLYIQENTRVTEVILDGTNWSVNGEVVYGAE
ncbi:hypothetical protein, partial [Motilimonas pumila]